MNGPLGGQVSAARLRELLGTWRGERNRQAAAELAAAIRRLAQDGRLPPGTRLPAERELAAALQVSRTMVGSAWDRLRASGLIDSRRGSGSWITPPAAKAATERVENGELIDLARASPPALPGTAEAFEAAAGKLAFHLAGHGYAPRGLPELRARLAARYTARGLPTTAEQILVTGGAHNAFVTLLNTFTNPGDRVLVEQPTYFSTLAAIRAQHVLGVPVALRQDGWSIDGMLAALRQSAPSMACLIPDFQNPTGHRMDTETRRALGAALRKQRTLTVVDETLVELDYAEERGQPPFACFAPDHVLTVGSTSKSHWGGLRIGWIRAPESLVERLLIARSALELGTPIVEQLAFTELLDQSPSILDERRKSYVTHRDVLAEALRENCPQWKFRVPDGGLALWCELDAPISSRLAIAAEDFGVRIAPGSQFSVHGGLERYLRVPFSLPHNDLRDAARRLAAAAAAVSGVTTAEPGFLS